ncbi:enhancer of mRNA-decapping protein 4 isoform X3 [Bombyx mori]|uniref:Enhancer of mRNA-decapping protein 4 n=1 Tax=Bombyx mori TaxID=7091 RepID=A0A8R2LU60_BOMMO|nr:enhancer of mRNA-decapping protein 4 isoform X3 [Bombyx mori]
MQPPTMLPKLSDTTQTIAFAEGDGMSCIEVYSSDVVVTINTGNHDHGSSKVKLKNLVDYNWEPKFYPGQLLAIHISGKYLAYSIKAPNTANPGTCSGMVRVVYNLEPGTDRRALIKGMKGEVQDLSFAHIQNEIVLACIDEQGNFYVHEIEATDSGLRCTLIAEIREDTGIVGSFHRVVWCPYIPDEEDDDPDEDVDRLLLTTHANTARIWNMRVIARAVAGTEGVGGAGALAGGAGTLSAGGHAADLVDAAFSPDGTALATAAADGYVMFFQVCMQNRSPRCLHKWQPHDGKPLSCLFFLDNHNNYNSDVQFWKFAVTGADNNTCIKIWSCKSWNCLQTISFAPEVPNESSLGLKVMLDRSARFLVVSAASGRALYVLGVARDAADTHAHCTALAHFLLPFPVLSFCIADAEEQTAKCESSCSDPFHRSESADPAGPSPDDFDLQPDVADSGSECGCVGRAALRLYVVQPKGLQEGRLAFALPAGGAPEEQGGEAGPAAVPSSILQQQSQQLKNLLMRSQTQPGSLIGQRAESPPIPPQLNLMTPDAFSSPGKREEEDPPLSATPDVSAKPRGSVGGDADRAKGAEGAGKPTSGGSSPSREVQEIMAHNDDAFFADNLEEESPAPPAAARQPEPFPDKPPPPPLALPHSNGDTSWPQISIAQITEANQRKASSDKSGAQSQPLGAACDARLDLLEHKLDKITELLQQQGRELRALRGATWCPRTALDEALQAHAQALDNAVTLGWERMSAAGEAAGAAAGAGAAQAAGAGAARALEPLVAALQHELAAKLTATDQLLRDNIDKLVNSKAVSERLSSSIARCVSEQVRESFRASVTDSLLPAMERAHAQIFRQVNNAFQNGTKEFAAHTEAAARAAAERGGAAACTALRAALDRHADTLAQHPRLLLQHATQAVRDAAHSVLEKELLWWREQARSASLTSRAHSPHTPHAHNPLDRQMQISQVQNMISSGDVNGAFQLALSASDLSLVVTACRSAEPSLVFGPPCQLKQHVLLSLVQQLAADMSKDTQLKHRYLEEAVMNLDTSSPVTREHLPGVVAELQQQVSAFVTASPSHPLARRLRMLLLASDALLKATV